MNKHKNHAKAQLEHLINRHSGSSGLLAKRPLLECPLFVNATHLPNNSHTHLVHKQLEDQTLLMLERLKDHQNYYMRLMEVERRKYDEHFEQMFKILRDQYEVGVFHIEKGLEHLRDSFERKRHAIMNAQQDLLRKQKLKRLRVEEKLQNLARETTFEIALLDVQLSDLTNFRADIRKYLIGPVDSAFSGCLEPSQPQQSGEPRINTRTTKDQQTQTETMVEECTEMKGEEMDDLLGCDEDMGVKLSASSRRRRKYEVGRRDVIKEQDESSESSVISES